MPILSFGSAVSVFAAQNYGANKYSRVLEGGRKTVLLCYGWSAVASLILIPFGHLIVRLLAGDVDQVVVDNSYRFILVNTALSFLLAPLVTYKSILQSVNRTRWTVISGFTEIIGRAGVAVLVLLLMNHWTLINESQGFFVMCFANPAAWLLGLLTIILDYIFLARRFRRMIADPTLPQQ